MNDPGLDGALPYLAIRPMPCAVATVVASGWWRHLRALAWRAVMGSLIKKRRKRMRKKKHKKMLRRTRHQRRK